MLSVFLHVYDRPCKNTRASDVAPRHPDTLPQNFEPMEQTMINPTRSIGAAAFLGLSMLIGNTGRADAAQCHYWSVDPTRNNLRGIAQGRAIALKMSTACTRAARECNRRLERAFRRGEAGRGTRCVRLS